MTINYNDLFLPIDIDGYNLIDNFSNKNLIISEINKVLERIDLKTTDRLDSLSTEYFDDDKLFWLLLVLNKDSLINPLALNYNYSELFNSLNKTLILNPIRYIKENIFDKLNEYLAIFNNINKQIESGNITCSEYHKSNFIFTLNEMIKLSNIIAKMPFKNEIEIDDDEDNPIQVFKEVEFDYMNETNMQMILMSILEDELNIYDDTKYNIVDSTLINFEFNIKDVIEIKYISLYTYYWSGNLK